MQHKLYLPIYTIPTNSAAQTAHSHNGAYRKILQTSLLRLILPSFLSVVLFSLDFVRAELMLVHRWDLGVQVFHVSQGRVSFDVTLLYPSLYFCL